MGDEKEFLRVKVGAHEVIPGFEEALYGMKQGQEVTLISPISHICHEISFLGSVRRIVVPLSLGYPDNSYRDIGPRPTTFSVASQLDRTFGSEFSVGVGPKGTEFCYRKQRFH